MGLRRHSRPRRLRKRRPPFTSECDEGETRTSACGLNGRGEHAEVCTLGHWVEGEACVDVDECLDGESSARTCGPNGRGTELRTCVEGRWTTTGSCEDDDVCTDGARVPSLTGCEWICRQGTWSAPACEVVDVSAGARTTCAVLASGRVACWGNNFFGKLGDGTNSGRAVPGEVLDLEDAVAVATGEFHTCALRADGTVACWGIGVYGNLGHGNSTSYTPVEVELPAKAVAIGAGDKVSCALLEDARAACWGRVRIDGVTSNHLTPTLVPIPDDAPVTRLAVGPVRACAKIEPGQVYCWDEWNDPTPVPELGEVLDLTVGRNHACARLEGGRVACWGENAAGQLGHGATSASGVPVDVVGLTDVVAIGSGEYHTCAALESGEVFCWGRNNGGQIGQGARGGNSGGLPLKVVSLPQDVTALAGGFQHTCAVRANGTTLCWGGSAQGQTGDGRPFTTVPLPVLWPMP